VSLPDIALRRPVFTGTMSLTLVVLGIIGARRLGTDAERKYTLGDLQAIRPPAVNRATRTR
jgi:hypothetical protein